MNTIVWKIDDASLQFFVADIVLLISLYFVRRGLIAESKLREIELHHMDLRHEQQKEAVRATKSKANHAQRVEQKRSSRKRNGGGAGGNNKINNNHVGGKAQHHIQQPMKK